MADREDDLLCRERVVPAGTAHGQRCDASILRGQPRHAVTEAHLAAARDDLITHNLRLVVYLAKKYENSGVPQEDMISIGTIGLIKAVNTFTPARNIKLATYASRCIENEVLMHFRNKKKSAQDVYISDPIDTDKDGNSLTLGDIMSEEDNIIDCIDLHIKSEQLYDFIACCLDERERQIIVMRYGLGGTRPLTQREVAKKLEISRSYVSRIEKKAIGTLRTRFEREGAFL